MPDGSFQRFNIVEAPIMHPDLAKKYPEIKSYAGYGIEDPAAYLRFDLTPQGFHAMMLNAATGHVFIDPYAREDNEHYVVYFKKDFYADKPWACEVSHDGGHKGPEAFLEFEKAGDCKLRTYSLALACTGEYTAFHGGSSQAMAAMNTTMTRVNGVFERDLSITMQLVANNDLLVFTNASTDPYTNFDASAMINENRTTCNNVIGSANYDIGHVFATGGAGLAYVKCVCNATYKGGGATGITSPVGDPFNIDYVCHEMGHQFGANHTQNNPCSSNSTTSVEPGSGSTIMGYAGICTPNIQPHSDAYFHAISIQEILAYCSGNGSGNACATLSTINNVPTCTIIPDYAIPKSTPFFLTGNGADPNPGDVLTYCWEQMDFAAATMPPVSTNTGGPTFRSIAPSTSPTRYFPNLPAVINNTIPAWEVLPSVPRTLNFRLTVRDNHIGGGCTKEDNIVVTVASSGPFVVTAPNTAVSWPALSTQTVTWNVASTTATPVSATNVDILLSTDGGLTYPITLLSATPNDGTQAVTLPENQTTQARIMVRGTGKIFYDISNVNFTIGQPADDFTVNVPATPQNVCKGGSSAAAINIGKISNFSGNVALSVTGLPTGVTASFSPAQIAAPGNAQLILNATSSTTAGNYNITVTGVGSTGTKTKVFAIAVITAPAQAVQSAPATGATNVSVTPTLSWTAVAGASSYEVQVATTNTFANPLAVNVTGITTTSYVVAQALLDNVTYYWRVMAVNNCGVGVYSATRSFKTLIVNDFSVDATPSPQAICRGGSTTITVNVGKIVNFSGNVTLSVTGLPSGVTASFSTTTVAAPGSAILTLNATTATIVGNYNITISGVGSTGTKTKVVVLSVVTTPVQTVQSAPATGATNVSVTPTLSWTAVSGASSYEVQVATTNTFTSPLAVDVTGVTTTSYIVPTALLDNVTYYWRVRAVNNCGIGVYSATRTFKTLIVNDFSVDATPSPQAICKGGSTTVTVNVGKILNFSGNVALSVTGLPSGVTANLSTSTVAVPGSAILTFTATTATTVGNYNITISGVGSTGTKTKVVVLSVVTTPAQAVQSAPATGFIGASLTPVLSWTAVPGATSYEVQIANNTAFTNPIVNATGITTLSYTSTPLPASTLLYWRVRAVNSCGTGVYSASRTFTTLAFNPKFEYGTLTNVSETWQTVNLTNTYTSMVVVASVVVTSNASLSIVTRVQNATGNSFQVKLQVAGNATGATGTATVYYMVAEEGTYTVAANGIKFEAKKHLSTKTSRYNAWAYEPKTHTNTYTIPVIVGQVMTYNDPNWSIFWSCLNTKMASPATATATSIGKHIGEDNVNTTRANETLGYMVFESGTGTINGKRYAAAIGADAVMGISDNAAGYSYALTGFGAVEGVAVSSAGQDATEGSWTVLATSAPLTTNSLKTWALEDQIMDQERTHTTDQVCYVVIGTAPALTSEETDDREAITIDGQEAETVLPQQIVAYPNPFTNELAIEFEQVSEGSPLVMVSDAFGRIVFRTLLSPQEVGQRTETLHLGAALGYGHYYLQVIDGKHQKVVKIIRSQ